MPTRSRQCLTANDVVSAVQSQNTVRHWLASVEWDPPAGGPTRTYAYPLLGGRTTENLGFIERKLNLILIIGRTRPVIAAASATSAVRPTLQHFSQNSRR